jgi:hypothetical protein
VIEKLAQNKWLQTNFYTINYKKLKQSSRDSQQDHQANEITHFCSSRAPLSGKSAQAILVIHVNEFNTTGISKYQG